MNLIGLKVDRRNFLVRAGTALLAAVLGAPAGAFARGAGRPVAVSGQIGTVFPSLRLAARLGSSARRHEIVGDGKTGGVIDVAIFPPGAADGGPGLMTDGDVAHVQRALANILADEFGYRATAIEADPGPAFWYPFAARRAVCCRLRVTPVRV